MKETFQFGDLVYAKMAGYPQWPARIDCIELSRCKKKSQRDRAAENDTEIMYVNTSTTHYMTTTISNRWPVYFFGTRNIQWIMESKLLHYVNNEQQQGIPSLKKGLIKKKDILRFKEALYEINREPFQDFQFHNDENGEAQMISFIQGQPCIRNDTEWDTAFPTPTVRH